ncbi:MAG: peptidase M50 [Acidobacteria bacterium]|nr:MAG: peptidase M50 [Acidobacteriota bacterium]
MAEKYSYPPTSEYLEAVVKPSVREQQKYFVNVLLFLGTVLTTLFWGAWMSLSFESSAGIDLVRYVKLIIGQPTLLYRGAGYSFAILSILLAHEMGHYLACCYYGIRATLPFFLPAPVYTGTFGAFIRIRSPFPNRRSLFDVGLAGPIAGFVVAIPFLWIGLKLSALVTVTSGQVSLGEPLIFKFFSKLLLLPAPAGKEYSLHPIAFAAWFACLATSLNLLPIAQLDGGHVSYALFGKKAYYITWFFFSAVLGLAVYGFTRSYVAGMQWLFYSVLLLVLRWIAGFRHPATMDDDQEIGLARKIWGGIALIVFIVTFMPVTIFS